MAVDCIFLLFYVTSRFTILVGWSDYASARALTNIYNNIYKLLWKWDVSCSWDLVEMRPSMHCNIMLLFARSELEDTWWLVHAVLQLWDVFNVHICSWWYMGTRLLDITSSFPAPFTYRHVLWTHDTCCIILGWWQSSSILSFLFFKKC